MNRKLVAEALGSFFLLATVIGSGIMGDVLSDGNAAVALLANSLATGAILTVMIAGLGPISGAHFNPVVTGVFWWRGEIAGGAALAYIAVHIAGGAAGVIAANLMFDLDAINISQTARSGINLWIAEFIATFGLIATILLTVKARPEFVSVTVGLYITAAYWFTASTSYANPAVTIARTLSNTFSGIAPTSAPGFIVVQCIGAAVAAVIIGWLLADN